MSGSASSGAGFAQVGRLAAEREGKTVRWNRRGAEDAQVAASVRALLEKDLGVEEAVQIALLNNPSLQATFEEIGIAQADLVQSGLLRNPVFHLGAQFGGGGTRLDYSAVASFLDVLRIPMRRRVAAIDLHRATLRAADAVLVLARDVRVAYWTVVARTQTYEVQGTAMDALEAAAELARRQHAAGNITDLDRMTEEDAALQAGLDRTRSAALLQSDREALARLLGLCGNATEWRVTGRLPDVPAAEPPLEQLERVAACQRLDLAAAREEVRAIAAGIPLTGIAPWSGSSFGVSGERDVDGQNVLGPDVTLEVPLFDTGRAAAARENARFRQAEHRYRALEIDVRSEVREARTRLLAAREIAMQYRDVVLPRRRRGTELWQAQFNAMLEGPYRLLQAKRDEIEAGRAWIDASRDYWVARADLERAVGGRLPPPAAVLAAPTPIPTSAPSPVPEPTPPAPKHKHGG